MLKYFALQNVSSQDQEYLRSDRASGIDASCPDPFHWKIHRSGPFPSQSPNSEQSADFVDGGPSVEKKRMLLIGRVEVRHGDLFDPVKDVSMDPSGMFDRSLDFLTAQAGAVLIAPTPNTLSELVQASQT